MSIALMTMARKTALPTNEKFVLMALADWADDNGTNCWPSIYELSEYLTCSERTVQRLLRELEQGGWIAVVGNHNGGGASRAYALNVPKMDEVSKVEHARREAEKERRRRERKDDASNPFLKGCQSVTPDKLSPVTTATQGVTTTTLRGDNCDKRGDTAVTLSTIDPPYIHHGTTMVGAVDQPANPGKAKKAKPTSAFVLPDWINKSHWDAWHSSEKRRKATDAQKQLAVEKLAKWRDQGIDHAKALEEAAIGGWQGLFEPKVAATPQAGRPANTHKHAAAAAAIYEGVWDA